MPCRAEPTGRPWLAPDPRCWGSWSSSSEPVRPSSPFLGQPLRKGRDEFQHVPCRAPPSPPRQPLTTRSAAYFHLALDSPPADLSRPAGRVSQPTELNHCCDGIWLRCAVPARLGSGRRRRFAHPNAHSLSSAPTRPRHFPTGVAVRVGRHEPSRRWLGCRGTDLSVPTGPPGCYHHLPVDGIRYTETNLGEAHEREVGVRRCRRHDWTPALGRVRFERP